MKSSCTNTPHRVFAIILAVREGLARLGIELSGFGIRSVIGKIPQVLEIKAGPRRVDRVIQIGEPSEFAAHFNAMTPGDLGEDIIVGVGPLVEIARSAGLRKS